MALASNQRTVVVVAVIVLFVMFLFPPMLLTTSNADNPNWAVTDYRIVTDTRGRVDVPLLALQCVVLVVAALGVIAILPNQKPPDESSERR